MTPPPLPRQSTNRLEGISGQIMSLSLLHRIELLPCLHQRSEALQRELGLESVRFLCADMLSASLASTGLLVLANQCWDKGLMRQTSSKVSAELPEGALCIEYTGSLGGSNTMQLLAKVIAPVSWNSQGLCFHVWRKRSEIEIGDRQVA